MSKRELILNQDEETGDDVVSPTTTTSDVSFLKSLLDPTRRAHRWLAFVFMAAIGFFPFFGTALPGSLQIQFMHDLDLSATEYSVFTSLTSWCNVVLCLFGGALIDKTFGVRAGNMLFCIVMIVGQVVFAIGAFQKSLIILIIGRLIFCAGCDVLLITQKAFAAKWFPKNEQSLVFGLLGSMNLLAATISQLTMVPIYNSISKHVKREKCLGGTIFVVVALLLLAAVASVFLLILDRRREKMLRIEKNTSGEIADKPKLADILRFPIPVWLLAIICTFIWGSLISFITLSKPLLIDKYDVSVYDTSIQMSLFFITTVIFSPIFGAVVSRFGRNMILIVMASVNLLICNTLLTYTYVYPWIILVAMGASIAIVNAALFGVFPNLVNMNQLGSVFGLVQSMINFGLALFSLFGGVIIDTYGYFALGIYFYYLSLVALIVTIVAYVYNRLTDGKLNLSRRELDSLQETK